MLDGDMQGIKLRKDARVDDWDGLENRCTLTGTEGSNPSLSAKRTRDFANRRQSPFSYPRTIKAGKGRGEETPV